MINNHVIRSVRHMMNVTEPKLVEIIALGGVQVTREEIGPYLKKEDEAGFVNCPDKVMAAFLDGIILHKRGKDESRVFQPTLPPITNNIVLKKIRVAFELKEDDLVAIMKRAGLNVSKAELGSFFRRPDHRNYRDCGDQFLRNLLKGMTP
jgi:uncharacterized protein YehS (DUF1456 family)